MIDETLDGTEVVLVLPRIPQEQLPSRRRKNWAVPVLPMQVLGERVELLAVAEINVGRDTHAFVGEVAEAIGKDVLRPTLSDKRAIDTGPRNAIA